MIEPASVTVAIPSVPERAGLLERALASVAAQNVRRLSVIVDRSPADWSRPDALCVKRDRLLAKVRTRWVATLDDDDTWDPDHLRTLLVTQSETRASVVYGEGRIAFDGLALPGNFRTISTALIDLPAFHSAGGWGTRCIGSGPGHHLDDICAQHTIGAAGLITAFAPGPTWTHYIDEHPTTGEARPHLLPLAV